MRDALGRTIDYLRISITDRCNFRCTYCMPDGVPFVPHGDILRYEEILTICRAALSCGITKFKVTGGEPFVRKGCFDFLQALKQLHGVTSVTVTTNGSLLIPYINKLKDIGIDGVNISLDTLDPVQFCALTGGGELAAVLASIEGAVAAGLRTKVNAVLLDETRSQILPLAGLSGRRPIDVRFIEVMPIGCGVGYKGPSKDEILTVLREAYDDLAKTDERRGNGPAVYYKSRKLLGRIGFIAAESQPFCRMCNRLRLTSTGQLKPCLCYDTGLDLRPYVSGQRPFGALCQAIADTVWHKPAQHSFDCAGDITEHRQMNEIGG